MTVDQVALPFAQKGTVHSRHASYTGAVVAKRRRGVKTEMYLQWLRRHGPATDRDAHHALGFDIGTINSIRNTLMKSDEVTSCGNTRTAIGTSPTLWCVKEV